MFRTQSAPLISAIANHPDVRPTLEGGTYWLDGAKFLSEPGNIAYACGTGMALFTPLWDHAYRGHIAFLRAGRGVAALAEARGVLDDLFANYDASTVVAGVPLQLRAARMFCKMLGFAHQHSDTEQEWMIFTGGASGRNH